MRVLYLTDSLSDLDGVGRYAMRLIAALERLEPALEVEVLLARKHRPTSSQVPPHWKVRVALPPDYFFHMSPLRYWPNLVAATARAALAARRADLVHAIKDYPHNLVALLAARAAGVPCIATAHGTYSVQPLVVERHRRRATWAYQRFAAMIAVSGYTARKMRETGGAALRDTRIDVIPNSVDASHYRERRALTGPRRPWHDVPFTLGIGELKQRKGHHLALEAWCHVARARADLHHFIVGKPSQDAYQHSLEALAAEAGLSDRVHFLGNVTEDEKIDLLQRAQVFLHVPVTSSGGGFEGFGIVYLEAAAAGTPSIGTLDSGAEDAIEDGRTGLLVAQEASAVEQALQRLLSDEPLRVRMGQEGRQKAAATSWDQNAARVLALYREVAG